jgi:hypothetical protein
MSMIHFNGLRDIIQEDVGQRGLARIPSRNLLNACPEDLEHACRSVAQTRGATLAVITGFYIPSAQPPAGETDGPLGAVFLARALFPLGIRVILGTDVFAAKALEAGLQACGLRKEIPLVILPGPREAARLGPDGYRKNFLSQAGLVPSHWLAVERVGPSHTSRSVQQQPGQNEADFRAAVPVEHHDRCHTMRGFDVTPHMSPAHWLFEKPANAAACTIGIGDGGNEIGMGKIPWDVIRDNIPNGGLIACRVPADHLIVCGVSNWGAYALAAGIHGLLNKAPAAGLFHPEAERKILHAMVEKGPLVDGVLGKPSVTVDGLTWEAYAAKLSAISADFIPK